MADQLEGSELAAYRQLKAGIEAWEHLNKKQKAWLDEPCLLRYLRARKFDPVAAKNMLAESLEWRFIDARPHRLTHEQVKDIASCMSCYFHMHTSDGYPVCYMRFDRDPQDFDVDAKLKYQMFCMEEAIRIAESDAHKAQYPNVEKMVYIIDLDNFSMSAPGADPAIAKGFGSVLSKHYPERLKKAYLLNYPGIFSTFWGIITMFIDPVTVKKVEWIPKPADESPEGKKQHYRDFFAQNGIPPELLEDCYGGEVPPLAAPNFIQADTYKRYPNK